MNTVRSEMAVKTTPQQIFVAWTKCRQNNTILLFACTQTSATPRCCQHTWSAKVKFRRPADRRTTERGMVTRAVAITRASSRPLTVSRPCRCHKQASHFRPFSVML